MQGSVAQWLAAAGAQHDLVEWATPFEHDLGGLWDACPRGDWLLALAARLQADRSALLRAAIACARDALDYLPQDERRPDEVLARLEAAVEAAQLAPERHEHERVALTSALDEAADPATAAAVIACTAVLDTFREASAGASAAAYAVQAATLDAADCGMFEALRFAQRQSVERVRSAIAREQVLRLWNER